MSPRHLLADFGEPDRHRELAPGEYLFRRGDRARAAYAVESGRVRLVRAQETGSELTLQRVHPGSSFAEAALFGPTHHCDARAEIRSRVAVYSAPRLAEALERDPELALAWARRLAEQVRHQRALLEVRSIASAEERILAYLTLGSDAAGELQLPSLRALASELGLAEETVYRAVARLERSERIARRGSALRLR